MLKNPLKISFRLCNGLQEAISDIRHVELLLGADPGLQYGVGGKSTNRVPSTGIHSFLTFSSDLNQVFV